MKLKTNILIQVIILIIMIVVAVTGVVYGSYRNDVQARSQDTVIELVML